MGRKSKLSEKQWADIGARLLRGEKGRALAAEFDISEAAIRARFNSAHAEIKHVANQIVATETALRALPISAQISAHQLASDLLAMSTHLAGAGKFGAATAHRLSGIAHAKVQEIDDAAPLDDKSREALRDVAVLTKMANEASQIPVNLLAANKDTIKRLNEGEEMGQEQLLREIAASLPD
jgi:hypothetical protein